MLNQLKIDSFKAIIPLSRVTINADHKQFLRTMVIANDDGEIVDERVNNSFRDKNNPLGFYYRKTEYTNIIGGKSIPVLEMGISSKCLGLDYFNGINKSNLKDVYDAIIKEGVVSFPLRALSKSTIKDVDIAIDILLDEENSVKEVCSIAKQLTRDDISVHVETYNKFSGITFGDRNKVKRAYRSKQFIKYYDKHLELMTKSRSFYEQYLKDSPVDEYIVENRLLRIETTICNRNHFDLYDLDVYYLEELLELELPREIIDRPMRCYISGSKPIKKSRTRTTISPTQHNQLVIVKYIMKLESKTHIDAVDKMVETTPFSSKVTRSRYKKKLLELVKDTYENKPDNKLNELPYDVLVEQGVFPTQELTY